MAGGPELDVELARQSYPNFRSVRLNLADDKINLDAQDMGPVVKEIWGDSDYEFGVRIASKDFGALACALIVEHYQGDVDAVDKIHKILIKHGIEPNHWFWI